jgi:hypothetical protein
MIPQPSPAKAPYFLLTIESEVDSISFMTCEKSGDIVPETV